jgi:hypothetical protein
MKPDLPQTVAECYHQSSSISDEITVSVEALLSIFDRIHAAGPVPEWSEEDLSDLADVLPVLEDIQAQCVFLRSAVAKLYSKAWEAAQFLGRRGERVDKQGAES